MKEYNLRLTHELAYIIGVLLGDGNNNKPWGKLRFRVKNKNFINKIKKCSEKQFKKNYKIKKRRNNDSYLYHLDINSKFISHNVHKIIKKIKKQENQKILCSFLEGSYDSEGCVDKNRLRIRFVGKKKNYVDMITYSLDIINIKYTLKKDKRFLS